MSNGQRLALVLGLVGIVIALALSFATVHGSNGQDCGNAWSAKTNDTGDTFGDYLDNHDCNDRLGTRRLVAGAFGAFGLVFVIGSTRKPSDTPAPPAASVDDGTY